MKDLIYRNTPKIADSFTLCTVDSEQGLNHYEVFCEDGKVVICGDSPLSQAMGYYDYLKKYCRVNISNCGGNANGVEKAVIFEGSMQKTVRQKIRAAFSYGTYSYSTAFWQWKEWEKEIDFLAMNGINMPLCLVGSEAVWYYTMRDFKYSETGALSYLSGPAFWPRQVTNNVTGYFSLTDVKYIESRVVLGKKIIDRMVSLGMTPVQPGFTGVLPKSIKKLYPKLHLNIVDSWKNFGFTFVCDPDDPLFLKFGKALLEKQRQLFGAYHCYTCDPFYDAKVPVKSKNYLYRFGKALVNLYESFDPQCVMVIHSECARSGFAAAIPKERAVVFDTQSIALAGTDRFEGFGYVAGATHSKGNRTCLHGSLDSLAENKFLTLPGDCRGVGIFTEGLYQNPLYYDLAFEMLTSDKKVNPLQWLEDYAERRWGSRELCLKDAAKKLYESCYSSKSDDEIMSVIAARPCTDLEHTAPFDKSEIPYDTSVLNEALSLLLSAKYAKGEGYLFDVCDVARQCLSNKAHEYYHNAVEGFNKRDVQLFERSSNAFLALCESIDSLLLTRGEFTLNEHLRQAGALALNDKDKENYELNLLALITVWGPIAAPVNYDYAWKEWGGVVGTYYARRWQSFFELLALKFRSRFAFSTKTKKQLEGRNEYSSGLFGRSCASFEKNWLSTVDPSPCSGSDTLEEAKKCLELINKE
ncbi:MAG: alpha-N-acetylglucosaminidase [Clostridiales bacterium]|nr:alpha-N-acetylglucosaminidase [Clostridiales bacterium]